MATDDPGGAGVTGASAQPPPPPLHTHGFAPATAADMMTSAPVAGQEASTAGGKSVEGFPCALPPAVDNLSSFGAVPNSVSPDVILRTFVGKYIVKWCRSTISNSASAWF